MFAILGGAGVYAWKTRPLPTVSAAPVPAKEGPAAQISTTPVRLAFLTDISQPWQQRIDFLRRELANECGEREIRYLYELLAKGAPEGELPEHGYLIANELMEQVLRHDFDARRFSSSLLELLHDSRQPLVVRDYVVQHLVAWLNPKLQHDRANPSGKAPAAVQHPPEITSRVLESLVAAATNPELEQTTIPGTTLMMLVNLARDPGEIDCSRAITALKPWLAAALEDGSTLGTPTRVSAVQAAGFLAPEEFRPVLRRIAYQENGQSSLRLPSIAALGQCGDADDITKLRQVAATHPELSYAATDACRVLTSRLGAEDSSALSK
jgi:hypothetical protein